MRVILFDLDDTLFDILSNYLFFQSREGGHLICGKCEHNYSLCRED